MKLNRERDHDMTAEQRGGQLEVEKRGMRGNGTEGDKKGRKIWE